MTIIVNYSLEEFYGKIETCCITFPNSTHEVLYIKTDRYKDP